jgi:hypothetical protein
MAHTGLATLLAIAGLANARAQDDKLPEKDRLARASLALVAAAWGFESSCGLPDEEDHALVLRYLGSEDAKGRDERVVLAIPTMFGAMTEEVAKDRSACTSLRATIETGAKTGRRELEYLIAHPGVDTPN